MRWHLVDRITDYEVWASISGRKVVSLEEYFLLRPFGRMGLFPETLALESCVELVRLLIMKSSGFGSTSILSEIDEFAFLHPVGAGAILDISVQLAESDSHIVRSRCRMDCGGTTVAAGAVVASLFPLEQALDRELAESMWKELRGAS